MFWLEHLRLVLARFQPLRLKGTAMERGVVLGCGGMRGDQRRHRFYHLIHRRMALKAFINNAQEE